MMFNELSTDVLAIRMERVNLLADVLLSLLVGNPQAQIITEIIIETSAMPEP